MKGFLLFFIFLMSETLGVAQVPQYKLDQPQDQSYGFFDYAIPGRRKQMIYRATDFGNPPSGYIENIYLKIDGSVSSSPLSFTSFRVQMGMTADTAYEWLGYVGWSQFKTGLVTVLFDTSYTISDTVASNTWLQIPLSTPFLWDTSQNLLVDIIYTGCSSPVPSFNYLPFSSRNRSLYGAAGANTGSEQNNDTVESEPLPFFGFDIDPFDVSVNDITKLTQVSLYPNPGNGLFTMRFHSATSAKKVDISIVSLTGSIVQQKQYENVLGDFSTQIDLRQVPKGFYFLEIRADEEKLLKKLIIQ
jgi:hypothetical protein